MNLYKENLNYGAKSLKYEQAKTLRRNETEAEKKLWQYLRNRKVGGYKFRRQHAIDVFIADFYCHEKKLVVELDGGIHDMEENREYDANRTCEMGIWDIKVIRFKNEEVINNIEGVVREIEKYLTLASDGGVGVRV